MDAVTQPLLEYGVLGVMALMLLGGVVAEHRRANKAEAEKTRLVAEANADKMALATRLAEVAAEGSLAIRDFSANLKERTDTIRETIAGMNR